MPAALARIWSGAVGLACGIAWFERLGGRGAAAVVAVGTAGLALRRRTVTACAVIACIAAGLGAIGAGAREANTRPLARLAERIPECQLAGAVVEQMGGLGTLVAIHAIDCGRHGRLRNAGTAAADLSGAHAGAALTARGWLVPLGTSGFDLARRRLGAGASLRLSEVVIGAVGSVPARLAAQVRTGLRTATEGLSADRAALIRGLAVGDTGGMPASAELNLRRAGLSHLVAVSGSNVAIVLGAIAFAVRRLGLRTRLVFGALGLAVFVLIVGPEPSVMRAAAMGGIGLAALALGRRADPLFALGLALIVVLAARPGMLYSVGLQLSAAATAGIVLWAHPLVASMRRLPAVVAVPLAVTIAAQVAVAPLLALTFGEVSIVAPAANLLAAPIVPFATVMGLASGVAGAVSPTVGGPAALLASPAAGWILSVSDAFGGAPWAAAHLPSWAGWFLAAVVLGGAAITLWRSVIRPDGVT
jgi:competence protein ComEC